MREVGVLIERHNEDMERQDFHAALVCAVLANVNRDPKREPFTPSDFMPSYDHEGQPAKEEEKEELDYLLELAAALGAEVIVHD